ncbi:DUF3429 domain-containing protein [Endozoicomonas sp. SCSIO W0465]|uniref:DUF3429 domain-containing protein n=1 Tax=Endozoicomonas sp. SCSIO W0465 TaxID=2918516 RepID=UPI00207598A4|nr:DUF3429 domain-containing protein [Endozoicomonas sp. SCSIO W0465]USE33936.1 DUF3429 domain-containing protein [Endozoicomonas sp. SCSIO W0465]
MYWLAWLGITPFIISLSLSIKGQSLFETSGEHLFIIYSVIICSFMAGSLWGQVVYSENRSRSIIKLLTSNVIALWVFGGLVAGLANQQMLVVLAIGYLATLIIECIYTGPMADGRVKSYLSMRAMVTLVVFILHCFLYAALNIA